MQTTTVFFALHRTDKTIPGHLSFELDPAFSEPDFDVTPVQVLSDGPLHLASDVSSQSLLGAVIHMTRNFMRDANRLGVEVDVHVDAETDHAVIVSGKNALLERILEIQDGAPSWARRILERESLPLGYLLDMDITFGHLIKKLEESSETPLAGVPA